MLGRLTGAAIALLVLLTAGPLAARPVVLGPEAMRLLGYRMLASGQAPAAAEIAAALLGRDPDDVEALILQAQAERALEHFPAALAASARAWKLAATPAQSYAAAMVRAQALSSAGRRTEAQLWLRRAVQAAPDERTRAVAVRDFGYVRSRNPWIYEFSATFAPSSNVNNGSSAQTLTYLGLPFTLSGDARALSGYELAFGATARYRLRPTAYATTELRFSMVERHYLLSEEARRQAPDAHGSDYDFAAVEFGLSQRRRSDATPAVFNWGAVLGHNWYGGADLSSYLRLNGGVQRQFGARTLGFADLNVERQSRADDSVRSATVWGAMAGLQRNLGNGDRLTFRAEARDVKSRASEIDHDSLILRVSWDRAKPVAGVQIGLELMAQDDRYARSPYTFDGRHDITVSAGLSMVFTRIDYYGFSPRLDLQLSRTSSNVSLYERRDIGLTLGLRSAF